MPIINDDTPPVLTRKRQFVDEDDEEAKPLNRAARLPPYGSNTASLVRVFEVYGFLPTANVWVSDPGATTP